MIRRKVLKVASNDMSVTGLKPDKLNRQQLRDLYEMTYEKLRVDPQIFDLFQRAVKEQWTSKSKWDLEMENLQWYRDNKASVREYLMLSANPEGADFIQKQKDSSENVRRTAMQLGVNLDAATLDKLSKDSMMQGWGAPDQAYLLEQAIIASPQNGEYGGDIQKNALSLKALAEANGVSYSEQYFESAGKSIASLATNEDYWTAQIRKEAASQLPVFAEQIQLGVNVRDIASPYLKAMEDVLEINQKNISLQDPTILGALSNYDSKGNPYAMNLGEFKRSLRKDKRWLETDKAQNEITAATGSVLKLFGLSG